MCINCTEVFLYENNGTKIKQQLVYKFINLKKTRPNEMSNKGQ